MDTAFTILGAITFCHLLNDTLQSLLPAIYPTLKQNYGLSFGQIGLITLTFQSTASLLQPVIGYYADRRPMPYSLAVGMGFSLLGLLLLSAAGSFPALIVAAGMVGLGSSVFHPESSRMASGGRHGLARSLFQVGGNAGSAIGPLLAAFIVVPRGQRSIAWFSVIALGGSAILWRVGHWYTRHHAAAASRARAEPGHGRHRHTYSSGRICESVRQAMSSSPMLSAGAGVAAEVDPSPGALAPWWCDGVPRKDGAVSHGIPNRSIPVPLRLPPHIATILAAAVLVVAYPPTARAQGGERTTCDSAAFRQFDFWVGDWDVTVNGKPAGTNLVTLEEDRCVVHEHWKGARGGTGQSFNFYDRQDGKWHQVWVSNDGSTLFLSGSYEDCVLTLAGESKQADGSTVLNRISFGNNPDRSVRQLWEMSSDGGTTWTAEFDGLYKRRKG